MRLPKSAPSDVVAVPRDALILREEATYVFKLQGDTVQQISVTTGIGNGSHIEVRGEVLPGDQIVIRGGERLQPGQNVLVTDS